MSIMGPERSDVKQTPPNIEIERKFIIHSLPEGIDLANKQGEQIEQGYLANGSGKNTVRIRRNGDEYYWTVKQRDEENPAVRIERECEITEEQFSTMWPATKGRRVYKTRYKIPYDEATIELDVYKRRNSGHMLAEVEFLTTLDADAFVPPEWFGPEVTEDNRFSNAKISKVGFPEGVIAELVPLVLLR